MKLFANYQKGLLAEFDRISAEYRFETIDASSDAKVVLLPTTGPDIERLGTDSHRTHESRAKAEPDTRATNATLSEQTAVSAESLCYGTGISSLRPAHAVCNGNGTVTHGFRASKPIPVELPDYLFLVGKTVGSAQEEHF